MVSEPKTIGGSSPGGTTSFRPASPADLSKILECSDGREGETTESLFRRFFASAHSCYVWEEHQEVSAYCWVFFHNYTLTCDGYGKGSMDLCLESDSAFIGNVFVRSDLRRQGVYRKLLEQVVRELLSLRQTRRFFVDIKSNNEPSLKAHAKLGFSVAATVYYLRILGARFLLVSTDGQHRIHRLTKGVLSEV